MRRIREARNLSLADVHDETKIPRGLIEAFEDKALFDHPQFNRVYLRSFVRTYAQVIGIEADVALEGLEEALTGAYTGSLAVAYLGEEPADLDEGADDGEAEEAVGADEEGAESEIPTAGDAPSEEAAKRSEKAPDKVPPTSKPRKKKKQPPASKGDEEKPRVKDVEKVDESEDDAPSYVSTTQATAAGFKKAQEEKSPEDEPVEEDWASQSPPSSGRESGRRSASRRSSSGGGFDRRWILGIGIVVVIGVLVWILMTLTGGSEQDVADMPAAGDTTEMATTPDTATQPSPAQPVNIPALGDTMDVRIVATAGKVDPIRVTVDEDLRRPYWIEEGDSMSFDPAQRIVIEELLDSVTVKVEGIEYPTSRRDPQGRLVITRDSAQTYFSTLRSGQ